MSDAHDLHPIIDLGEYGSAADAEAAAVVAEADGDPELACELFLLAGESQMEDGEPGRGVTLFRRALTCAETSLGPDHEDTLVVRGFLGRALTEASLFRESEAVLAALLVDRERLLGADHPSTLVTRGNLARAIGRGGRPLEAIAIAERLLADRERLLGADHPSTLDSRGHLAQFHHAAGHDEVALDMMTDLLADRQRVLDPDDPVIASTEHNLVLMSTWALDPDEALAALQANVARQTERFGAHHPGAFCARSLVASHLHGMAEYEAALEVLHPLLADRARVLGELSPATLETACRIVANLQALGRHDEALRRVTALVRAAVGVLGPKQVDALRVREFHITALASADRLDEAVELLEVLADDVTDLEPDHPLRAWVDDAMSSL